MKRLLPFAVLIVAAACSDGAAPFAPSTESASVSLLSRTAAAKESKVAVCHVDDMGAFKLINVNGNALKAHLGHGDKLPGDNGCGVAVDPFVFGSVALVFVEESLFQITWTVQGAPSAVSFAVELFAQDPFGPPGAGMWMTQEVVTGTGPGMYASADIYGAGEYRIVATLSNGNVVTSASVIIP